MKQLLAIVLFLSTCFITACNSTEQQAVQLEDSVRSMVKPFSRRQEADTFKIKLSGAKPDEMQLIFDIQSFEGHNIYHQVIKASELLGNYDATINLSKKKNQLKFMKEELDRFFEEENLMEPALTAEEMPDENVPDKVFYNELKKSQLNGFSYRLGKDNKRYIAWSEKDKKVKIYYNCCNLHIK